MSARTLSHALAAVAAAALLAAPPARAQSLPNITAPKTAAANAAAATNAHIQAEQNTGQQPPATPSKTTTPARQPAQQAPVKPAAPPPAPAKTQAAAPAPAPAKGAPAPAKGAAVPPSAPATAAKGAPAPQKGAPAAAQPKTAPDQSSSVSQRGGKSEIELLRETFTYVPDNRRDPFLSLMRTGDLRPMVSDLRLVAVIYDPAGRSVAILRDLQTKEQYRVRVGQTLGRMRVNQIRPQQVIFTIEEIGMTRQEALSMNATTTPRAQ
jgi:hypothetical protein